MRMITVTHANIPDTKISVVADQIFCYYYSQAHKCTHLIGPGSSMIPVSESMETIQTLLTKENTNDKLGTDSRPK